MSLRQRAAGFAISAAHTRAARGLLGWSVPRLAMEAGVAEEALSLFEAEQVALTEADLIALASALYAAGVITISADLAGEGVRLRRAPDGPSKRGRRTSFAGSADPLPDWLPLGGCGPGKDRG
jgi:transcriptional regulator with XRE-family HTH domain